MLEEKFRSFRIANGWMDNKVPDNGFLPIAVPVCSAVQCRTGSRQQQQGKDCILIMGLAAGAVQRGSGAGDRIINDKGSSNIHIDQVHHR